MNTQRKDIAPISSPCVVFVKTDNDSGSSKLGTMEREITPLVHAADESMRRNRRLCFVADQERRWQPGLSHGGLAVAVVFALIHSEYLAIVNEAFAAVADGVIGCRFQ